MPLVSVGEACEALPVSVGAGDCVAVGAPGGCVGGRLVAEGVSLGTNVGTVCAKAEFAQTPPAFQSAAAPKRQITNVRRCNFKIIILFLMT
jgi:hypothetical protein